MKHAVLVALVLAMLIVAAAPGRADWEAGLAAYNRGEFETAATEMAKYVAGNPTDPRYAIAYYLLGRSYLQLDRTDEGIANLRTAVRLDPEETDYRLALGQSLLSNGNAAEARTVLEALDPMSLPAEQRVSAALLLASAALELGEPATAVAVLEAQLPAAEESSDLHRALGLACYRNGAPERAFSELARAYDLDPVDAATGRNAVMIALDLASDQTAQDAKQIWHQNAYEVAEKLATGDPTPSHLAMAGRAAHGAGLDEAAATWLAKACDATPGDPRLAYDLGRTLAALDEDQRALAVLDGALRAAPEADLAVRIHRQMAKIYARNLELPDAALHFQRAGDERAAQQIGDLVSGFQKAIERRRELLANISELRSMEAQLEELNDSQGVTAVRERADAMQDELEALEANLQTVRQALQNL